MSHSYATYGFSVLLSVYLKHLIWWGKQIEGLPFIYITSSLTSGANSNQSTIPIRYQASHTDSQSFRKTKKMQREQNNKTKPSVIYQQIFQDFVSSQWNSCS